MIPNTQTESKLKRVLGLRSLIAIAVGVVVAQVAFISVLQGVGIGGAKFFVALLIAFFLALFYVFTFAELALMMPKAGSLSTYTEVSIGHFPAIIVVILGYVAPAIFGLPAELFLLEAVFDSAAPDIIGGLGLVIVFGFATLNILGVDIFSRVQNFLAYLMITSLIVIGIVGISSGNVKGVSFSTLIGGFSNLDWSVLNLTMLALWAFMALEMVCPMIEETKNPKRNIPRSMIMATFILLVVYTLIALAGYLSVPAAELAASEIPHFVLVSTLFGNAGKYMLLIIAITATCSTINTVFATIPRMLFGMAKNNQLPALFGKLHPRFNTPYYGIIFMALIILLPYFIFRNAQDIILTLVISAATVWLVAYIIIYINLIVLRKRYPDYERPFKSPLFPWLQIVGIIAMVYMIINNSPTPEMTSQVYMNAGIMMIIVAIYAGFWVKYKMKKGLLEPESIEQALKN